MFRQDDEGVKRISKRRRRELGAYRATSADVAERDQGVCVRCLYNGTRVKAVDIAHILPRSAFGGKRKMAVGNQLKNLVCLCRSCHKATETFNGRVELFNIMKELHPDYDYSGLPWDAYAEFDCTRRRVPWEHP